MRRGAKPPYRHNQDCRRRFEKGIKQEDRERWERYLLRRPPGRPACSDPEDSSEEEFQDNAPEAPTDEHGFPMVSELVERLMKVDVTEVFSPPRVTTQASKFGLEAGEAWDLTTGWDFSKSEHRERAEAYVEDKKRLVVIGNVVNEGSVVRVESQLLFFCFCGRGWITVSCQFRFLCTISIFVKEFCY